MINEKLLAFIWRNRYYDKRLVVTTDNKPLSVEYTGTENPNEGPDFLNAKIKIGDITWSGNIEIDLKKSFWKLHKHDKNKHYKNVVLHVVWENDTEPNVSPKIPTIVLKHFVPKYFMDRYFSLMNSDKKIICEHFIDQVRDFTWIKWKERLIIEKNEGKVNLYKQLLAENKNHWEQTFFTILCRNFGVSVNSDNFYTIAKSIPITIFSKIKSSLFQIEALLFGQANLLDKDFEETYPQNLKQEYHFLLNKYNLSKPMVLIQFLRIRPPSFPTIRLAQLASLIHKSSHLFSKILETEKLSDLMKLFNTDISEYWQTHYQFDKKSTKISKNISYQFKYSIIINTIVPTLFLYAYEKKMDEYFDRATHFLEQIPFEKNIITKMWNAFNIACKSAFDSQSLIYLYKHYCLNKKCLQCAIGSEILRS